MLQQGEYTAVHSSAIMQPAGSNDITDNVIDNAPDTFDPDGPRIFKRRSSFRMVNKEGGMELLSKHFENIGFESVDPDPVKSYKDRLKSFHNWPIWAEADYKEIALYGMRYIGVEDKVQCEFCRGILYSWSADDRPLQEHQKHFDQCLFLKGETWKVVERYLAEQDKENQQQHSYLSAALADSTSVEGDEICEASGKSVEICESSGGNVEICESSGRSVEICEASGRNVKSLDRMIDIVSEMGYDSDIIDKAVHSVSKMVPRNNIDTEVLLDAIFNLENQDNLSDSEHMECHHKNDELIPEKSNIELNGLRSEKTDMLGVTYGIAVEKSNIDMLGATKGIVVENSTDQVTLASRANTLVNPNFSPTKSLGGAKMKIKSTDNVTEERVQWKRYQANQQVHKSEKAVDNNQNQAYEKDDSNNNTGGTNGQLKDNALDSKSRIKRLKDHLTQSQEGEEMNFVTRSSDPNVEPIEAQTLEKTKAEQNITILSDFANINGDQKANKITKKIPIVSEEELEVQGNTVNVKGNFTSEGTTAPCDLNVASSSDNYFKQRIKTHLGHENELSVQGSTETDKPKNIKSVQKNTEGSDLNSLSEMNIVTENTEMSIEDKSEPTVQETSESDNQQNSALVHKTTTASNSLKEIKADASKKKTVNEPKEARAEESTAKIGKLKEERDSLQKNVICNICNQSKIELLFLPCRHMVACESCGSKIESCIKCSKSIVATVRIYLP